MTRQSFASLIVFLLLAAVAMPPTGAVEARLVCATVDSKPVGSVLIDEEDVGRVGAAIGEASAMMGVWAAPKGQPPVALRLVLEPEECQGKAQEGQSRMATALVDFLLCLSDDLPIVEEPLVQAMYDIVREAAGSAPEETYDRTREWVQGGRDQMREMAESGEDQVGLFEALHPEDGPLAPMWDEYDQVRVPGASGLPEDLPLRDFSGCWVAYVAALADLVDYLLND